MDDATRRAVLASVEGDIARLESELEDLRRLQAYLSRSQGGPISPPTIPPSRPLGGAVVITPPAPSWADLAAKALREAGPDSALRAPELADVLVSRHGVAAREGRALERKIYTVMMRRKDLFVNTGGGHWTLAEFRPDLVGRDARDDEPDSDLEDSDTER